MFTGAFINLTVNDVPFYVTFPILLAVVSLVLALILAIRKMYMPAKLIICTVPIYLMVYLSVAVKSVGLLDNIMMYLIPRIFSFTFLIVPIFFFGVRKYRWTILVVIIDIIPILLFDKLHEAYGIYFSQLEFDPEFYSLFFLLLVLFFIIIFGSVLLLQQINSIFVRRLRIQNLKLDSEKEIIKNQNNSLKYQSYLYRILEITSTNTKLEETLTSVLEELFSIDDLDIDKKGVIFLKNAEGKLDIMAHKNVPALVENYSLIDADECLCDEALLNFEILFCNKVEHHNDSSYSEKGKEHYIIPIKNRDDILGFITVFSEKNGDKQENITQLLIAVSEILSNKIQLEKYNAKILASQKEINDQNEVLSEILHELNGSLSYATSIQNSMLPQQEQLNTILDQSYCLFLPKSKVSGDFYFSTLVGDCNIFGVGDCTGHGIPGAILAAMSLDSVHQILKDFSTLEVNEILNKIREVAKSRFYPDANGNLRHDSMDAAICKYSRTDKKLSYSGGNMECIIVRSGKIIELKPTKNPIGHFVSEISFDKQVIDIHDNDVLYIFSDGLKDQFGRSNPEGKIGKLKRNKMYEWLLEIQQLEFEEHHSTLLDKIDNWSADTEQTDDITLFSVKFQSSA